MAPYHTAIAHAAYHDLLRSLKDEAVSSLRGTPGLVERNGRKYWYDSYRVGSQVRKRYIGEDSEALRSRLAKAAEFKQEREHSQRERARLIRILRAEGFVSVEATTASLISALAAAGVFRLGGTIVGTLAFRLYEGELGIRLGMDEAASTNDMDIASFERLSLALSDDEDPRLQQVLSEFSFVAVPSLGEGRTWRWKQTRNELVVEFLTPSFSAEEDLRPLAALGVYAQSLHFLNYLIAEPIDIAIPYRSGVLAQAPRPERFAIHKLIVADRRQGGPDALKSRKDRRQAQILIETLARDRPDDLALAFSTARNKGPAWRERIDRSLARMPEAAAALQAL